MSLVGYDAIVEGKTHPAAGLTTKDLASGLILQKTAAVTRKDTHGGFQEEKNILELQVTEGGAMKQIDGLSVNGVRIDFDHKSLVIKTKGEDAFYQIAALRKCKARQNTYLLQQNVVGGWSFLMRYRCQANRS
jgi:hypothetical protein